MYYRITDSMHISKVPLKKPLSYTNTKVELTIFLAKTTKQRAEAIGEMIVGPLGTECKATHKDETTLDLSRRNRYKDDNSCSLSVLLTVLRASPSIHRTPMSLFWQSEDI